MLKLFRVVWKREEGKDRGEEINMKGRRNTHVKVEAEAVGYEYHEKEEEKRAHVSKPKNSSQSCKTSV